MISWNHTDGESRRFLSYIIFLSSWRPWVTLKVYHAIFLSMHIFVLHHWLYCCLGANNFFYSPDFFWLSAFVCLIFIPYIFLNELLQKEVCKLCRWRNSFYDMSVQITWANTVTQNWNRLARLFSATCVSGPSCEPAEVTGDPIRDVTGERGSYWGIMMTGKWNE